MIHATLLEHITDDADREAMNLAILGRTPAAPEETGPLRYARPGEIVRKLETVPVADAIAALTSAMPGGAA